MENRGIIITDSNMERTEAGKKLVELRGKKSQEEVARAVGITQAALSMYERGERTPRDDVKVKLANYFESDVAFIFF